MKSFLFFFISLTPIACSTSESQVIADDITKERLRVEIADTCYLVQERGGKYLKCENEGMFAVGDDCKVKRINGNRFLICEG